VIEVIRDGGDIILLNTGIDDFRDLWYEYFDLGRDYGVIKRKISKDSFSGDAAVFASGLRILRQEYFETVVSFIASQNNNIPRIAKIIESICRTFGREISYKGKSYYAFPTPDEFRDIDEKDLEPCRAGYRCSYFSGLSKSRIPIREELEKLDLCGKREKLCRIAGIGPKVADCILLFSGIDTKAFPIDVWVRKVMKRIYGVEGNNKTIYDFAYSYFDGEPGIAQQYLFYYARNNLP
jgi:N-glycosylase/DNA lyase